MSSMLLRWVVACGALACGGARPPGAARAVVCARPACAAIDDGGVGEVRIGAPLPAALLGADLEARFVARTIADGVPIDAFRLDAPPVLAVVRGRRELTSARDAAAEARAGALRVSAVHVEDPGPRTAYGAGVGSTLAELRGALGDVRVSPVPTTYGGDECVGLVAEMPAVWFYFASCAAAEAGSRVVRVMVVDPRDE